MNDSREFPCHMSNIAMCIGRIQHKAVGRLKHMFVFLIVSQCSSNDFLSKLRMQGHYCTYFWRFNYNKDAVYNCYYLLYDATIYILWSMQLYINDYHSMNVKYCIQTYHFWKEYI